MSSIGTVITVDFFPSMDSFHMVTLIPSAWKAIVVTGTFTSREFAEVRVDSMIVQSMHFALVSEQAGIGGEP